MNTDFRKMSGDQRASLRTAVRTLLDRIHERVGSFRFHELLGVIIVAGGLCLGLPSVPANIGVRFAKLVGSEEQMSEPVAEQAVELLRSYFLGDTTRPLPVVVCPDLGKKPEKIEDICCFITSGPKEGCDSGAGTIYRAKTNGVKIWVAPTTASESGRTPFDWSRLEMPSERAFALAHEFGHVLYFDPTTKRLFDALRDFYWEAAGALTQEERLTRVLASENDFHEMAASMFAANTLCPDAFKCK